MTITTKPLYVPQGLTKDRVLAGMLNSIVERVEKPRIENVTSVAFSDPITNGEVVVLATQFNDLLTKLKASGVMESDP